LPQANFFDTSLIPKKTPLILLKEIVLPYETNNLPKETQMFLKENNKPPTKNSVLPLIPGAIHQAEAPRQQGTVHEVRRR
jgi:hypothetical protein